MMAFTNCRNTRSQQDAESSTQQEINFIENDWAKAQALAKQSNKLIFIDVYATWCGPCTQLKKTTFRNPKVSAFFNTNFINLSIDAEKGIGPQLSTAYNVSAYPTLLFVKPDGKSVLYAEGFMPSDYLIDLGKQALQTN